MMFIMLGANFYSILSRLKSAFFVCVLFVVSACTNSNGMPTYTALPLPTMSPVPTFTSTAIPTSTKPRPIITNGMLAYLMFGSQNNNSRIKLIDVASGEIRDIVFECYFCYSFSWSPDGTQIALIGFKEFSFDMRTEILMFNIEDGTTRRVADSLANRTLVSWSPDGKHLLYLNLHDESISDNEIEIMELATSKIYKLTNTKGWKAEPKWSPDGKYIAYYYQEQASDGHLWIMESNGNNPRQISNLPLVSYQPQISWSPDSARVAFSSPNPCGDLYIVDVESHETKKLVDMDGCITDTVWSPDGKAIAFLATTYLPVTNQVKDWQIYLVSIDGKEIVPLLSDAQKDRLPPLYLGWVPVASSLNTKSP